MATPERTGDDERARARAGHEYRQLYAPKALVLLSHYPFYNLFTQFLQQVSRGRAHVTAVCVFSPASARGVTRLTLCNFPFLSRLPFCCCGLNK